METRPTHSTRSRAIRIAVGVVALLVLGAVAWIGLRGVQARQELHAITPLVNTIQDDVGSGDLAAARAAAAELQAHASRAADLTGDPIWRAAEILPIVGPNLAAPRQVAEAARAVSEKIITPLVALSRTIDLEKFKPVNGRLDLAPLSVAGPALAKVQAAYAQIRESVDAIGTAGTIGPISDAVVKVRDAIAQVGPTVTALGNSVRLLPGMLGADGPRNILLLAQNPAELRSTGGLVGALALIHAQDGAITLVSQASTSDFPVLDKPILTLPAQTQGIYGQVVGRYIQDVTVTPDFPVAARLASAMWSARFGGSIDAVVTVDPVTLGYILAATGPATLPTGQELTSGNAVSLLLSDAYREIPPGAPQDAFFASAAASVFSKVVSGSGDATSLIRALARAGSERRILVWSSHDSEQSILAGTTLAGRLPSSTRDVAGIGVYFNDGTGGKMDYYLKSAVSVASGVCRADGRPTSRVTVTLTNTAPSDAGQTLPAYVTGNGIFGVTAGMVRTRVAVYGATDGLFVASTGVTAKSSPDISATYEGRPVAVFTVDLRPGESKTMTADLLNVEQRSPGAELTVTPTLGGTVASNVALNCQRAVN